MPAMHRLWSIKVLFLPILAVACSCSFFTSSAEAQTTWLISVDVSSKKDIPVYSIKPKSGTGDTCDSLHKNNNQINGDIYVCPQDTILWTGVTKNGIDGNMHHHMVIRLEEGLLDRAKGGDSEHIFHAREGANDGGPIDDSCADDSCYGVHEYSVFIFDKNGPELYVHDPKIIIGGTTLVPELVRLEKTLAPLLKKIAKDPNASPREKELAVRAQRQIDRLKKQSKQD